MDMSFEDLVRERAYYLWLAGGTADGHEHEHWEIAEQAVKADIEPVVILTKAAKPAAKRAAKTTTKTSATKTKAAAKPAAKKAKAEVAASL